MSDQDFFFDDEEVEESPKGGAKKPSPKGGSPKQPVKPAKPVAAAAAPAEGVSFFEQAVPMQIVALVAVIALLVGVIGGFFLAPKQNPGSTTVLPASTGTGTGSTGTGGAPSLTEDQLNSGQMPAGHPDVSGAESTATTTP